MTRDLWRPLVWLVAFGATVGTLLDAMHTFSGTTEYTAAFVLRTAWWVPLLFASAYGLGGFLYAVTHARLTASRDAPSWRDATLGVAAFAALYAASAYLPAGNAVKLGVLMAGAVALWAWLDRTRWGIALAAVAAVAGPLTEIALTRLGMFRHRQPDAWGVPMWLPALYLASGPSFGQFARRVVLHTRRADAA